MIYIYRLLTTLLAPFWIFIISIRILKGKENVKRINERFGIASINRLEFLANNKSSNKPNELVWIHAASIGESFVALTVAKELLRQHKNLNILITTGTTTSAKIISSKIKPRMIHQFIPVDEYFAVKRFIKYWKPKLGIMVESEIWPNLIDITAQYCPLILVNATLSNSSYRNWQCVPNFAKYIMNKFSYILCQDESIKQKYYTICSYLGHPKSDIISIGNLKFSSEKPIFSEDEMSFMKKQIGDRKTILAASTHPGDEDIICRLHQKLKKQIPNLLTIIAPRHPHRADEIIKLGKVYSLRLAQRSEDQAIISGHVSKNTDIYLADTLGELGIFYTLADVTLIGGSYNKGGHNLIEPAFFDTTIIFGPDMKNFRTIAKEFLEDKAAIQVHNEAELLDNSLNSLQKPQAKMQEQASNLVVKHKKIIDQYLKIITSFL